VWVLMCRFRREGRSKLLPHSEHGSIVLSLLFMGTSARELDKTELSAALLLAGLMEPTEVGGGVLGDAGGVRPDSFLVIKFGYLKLVCGLSRDGVTKGILTRFRGEK